MGISLFYFLFDYRFSLKSNGPRPYSPGVMEEYPLVQLQGNHKIVLEHYPKKVSNSGRYEVRMHEDDWVRVSVKAKRE